MIKVIRLTALAAVFTFFGCSEEPVVLPSHETEGEELVEFTVTVSGSQTKLTGTDDMSSDVHNTQVFVFNTYGICEAYTMVDSHTLTMTCPAGKKRVVALVNAKPETGVVDVEDLARRTSDLRNVTDDDLVMVGETTVDVPHSKGHAMNITVKRLVAQVILSSVTLDFGQQEYQDMDFEITSVYMINVAGEKAYMEQNVPSIWYNEGMCDPVSSLPFLCDAVTDGALVSGGDMYETEHYFYCYPNETEKKTRLVIETLIDGMVYYYPITLDKVEANNRYFYDVVLTRLGSMSPDQPVEDVLTSFVIATTNWKDNMNDVEI